MSLPKILVPQADGTVAEEIKPLEMHVNMGEMTIGDTRLVTGRLNKSSVEMVAQFGDFLIAHTNWTEQEVDQIGANEMDYVAEKVKAAFAEQTVPNSNGTSSDATPA